MSSGSPAPAYEYTPHSAFTEDWNTSMANNEVQEAEEEAIKKNDKDKLSQHPDILSPGLEPIYYGHEGKEVVPQQQHQQQPQQPFLGAGNGNYPHHDDGKYPVNPEGVPNRNSRIFGMKKSLFLGLLAFLLILAIGLGVGLGVGLGTKKNSSISSSSTNGLSVNPAYLSKSGAFNGTGLAVASYSFGSGGYGVINVFFQHFTGQLRKMQLGSDGTWVGGDSTTIVATDARNSTPISAVAYALDFKSTVHIFYIDKQNIIREKVNDNTTNQWRDGPIGDLKLTAMNDTAVGLQACWYGSFYGNANYTHSPIPGTAANTTTQDQVIGMHLWYGRTPTQLEEVTWTYNTTEWYRQDNFTANGHAGIGCYSWGPGSVSYVMMVNLDNAVQMAWKDLNSSVQSTSSHPVNTWVNTTWTIPNVEANTSLGYTNYFYAQNSDGHIGGWNVSWDAENTKLSGDSFTIPEQGLPGTHFSVTAVPNSSGGNSLMVFNQQNGSDITENLRDLANGQWSYTDLPVPSS